LSRRYRRRSYDAGKERALQHIREARELSRELGGTDEDVKRYFFGLSGAELLVILNAYEKENGKEARRYAEETIPAWRSGSRQMSGQNAARLFKLLPRFMPLERKYGLVELLWEKQSPRSENSVAFGPNAEAKDVGQVIDQHMTATVTGHTISEALQCRFLWLADGDSQAMQQLLNHFLMRDRKQAVTVVSAEVALILQHARADTAVQAFRRELRVGGHTVHIFLDPLATDVKLTPGPPKFRRRPDYSWIIALCIIAVIVALVFLWRSR
jgi:hypothetical protein